MPSKLVRIRAYEKRDHKAVLRILVDGINGTWRSAYRQVRVRTYILLQSSSLYRSEIAFDTLQHFTTLVLLSCRLSTAPKQSPSSLEPWSSWSQVCHSNIPSLRSPSSPDSWRSFCSASSATKTDGGLCGEHNHAMHFLLLAWLVALNFASNRVLRFSQRVRSAFLSLS